MRPQNIFAGAQRVIPGGVNSRVRAYKAVGGEPVVIVRGFPKPGLGRGRQRVYRLRWFTGPLILAHAYCEVVRAISDAAAFWRPHLMRGGACTA